MNILKALRVLSLGALLVTLGLSTQSAFAAHVGGGGGGFHGGGGGYHGGYGGGGYHGGYGGGYHGGYGYRGYGYGGYGWGYPGWGWDLSFNFGWPWGYGYPYAYGYYPYYGYSPYYYPYPYSYGPASGPSGYPDTTAYGQASVNYPNQAPNYPDQAPNYPNQAPNYPNRAPVAQPGASVPQSAPNSNSLTLHEATYVPRPPSYRSASATGSAANYHPASAAGQLPAMRPEVQNVIRALRGMPPAARQRAIDSGQYSGFSPQELKLVTYAANLP